MSGEKHDLAWWAHRAGEDDANDHWTALFGLLAPMEEPRDPGSPWWTTRPSRR